MRALLFGVGAVFAFVPLLAPACAEFTAAPAADGGGTPTVPSGGDAAADGPITDAAGIDAPTVPRPPFACPIDTAGFFCDDFERDSLGRPDWTVLGSGTNGLDLDLDGTFPRAGAKSLRARIAKGNKDTAQAFFTRTPTSKATTFVLDFAMRIEGGPGGSVTLVDVDFPRAGTPSTQTISVTLDESEGLTLEHFVLDVPAERRFAYAPTPDRAWHDYRLVIDATAARLVVDGRDDTSMELAHGPTYTLAPPARDVRIGVTYTDVQPAPFFVWLDDVVMTR